jgi:DNA mismatch endonuclease (patch repair protein)
MKKTHEQISYNMHQVKNKDSVIELTLRKELWSRGIRYRKNVSRVLGKPDIAFLGKKIAVFCDSEFWHGFNWEEKQNEIKSNRDFWIPKIERNIERDREVNAALEADGWIVLRFWGNDIKKNVKACADLIVDALKERDR